MNVPSGFQLLRPGIKIWKILFNKNSVLDELNVQKGDLYVKKKEYRVVGQFEILSY
jgi:hypothetical protein